MRRSGTAMVAAMTVGGLLVAGCGGKSTTTTPTGPSGSSATGSVVTVRGDDALRFDQASYSATAGSVTFALIDDGSNPHTLLIDKQSGLKKLTVSGKGDKAQGSVTLAAGTYTIYCDIPGHRSAGMEAKLVVS